jgi:hypothetical protein
MNAAGWLRPGCSVLGAVAAATSLHAQGYSARLESRLQMAAFRGVTLDSVAQSETVMGPTGGPETLDGVAVSCLPSGTCYYFRPGAVQRAAPLVQSAALTAWGLGVSGLSVHADGRLIAQLGDAAWAGGEPAMQLLEGYVEYAPAAWSLRLGRQQQLTRLGPAGFDGILGGLALLSGRAQLHAFAGWGLARATALPITSPALNPLDEYRPSQRTRLYGADLSYAEAAGSVRLDYQRELDGRSSYFVSERVALSTDARVTRDFSAAGGAEYDLAEDRWGSADLQLRYVRPAITTTVAARHYRPHFDLWTIWGAFSPVPFNAVSAAIQVRPSQGLVLRARGERYWFEAAEVSTPLVSVEDAGWRASVGGSLDFASRWRAELDLQEEFGPGAASRGAAGAVTYSPRPGLDLRASAAALERPLEFRYGDAGVNSAGLDLDWSFSERMQATVGIAHYWQRQDRPDASGFDWNQTRLNAGLTLVLGGVSMAPLPPARRLHGGRAP